MSDHLRRNVCRLRSPGTLISEVERSRVADHISPEVQYACCYWVGHLQQSAITPHENDQVHKFLEGHFLHWLEALSLLGKMSEGVLMVLALQSVVMVSDSVM